MLPGTYNFRDLGGLSAAGARTRSGLLMRSDAPLGLGPSSARALAEIGLRTAVDLREPIESQRDPVDLRAVSLDLVAYPLIDGLVDLHDPTELPTAYSQILSRCGHRIAAVAEILARPGALPALYFCSAGKDRTGLLSALLLAAIGVEDDAVAADYAKTAAVINGEFREELVQRALAVGLTEQALAVKLAATPDLILGVLERVRSEHGGAGPYLIDHGLSAASLTALREALLEPLDAADGGAGESS